VWLLACTVGAWPIQAGKTAQGWVYASGGVSHEELAALHAKRDSYSLWVITAAMKSGAYQADVRVTIRDAKQRLVFDRRLDGPWLFIDLPLGRYEVEAELNGEAHKRKTTIHSGDHHQVFFYFDVPDIVSPEDRRPFEGNPYSNGKK
jgi:hypothetical protein